MLNEYSYMDVGIKMICFMLAWVVFAAVCDICLAFAVNYDCRAKNNQKRTMWTVLVLFFPFIAGIVYLCTRNDVKNLPPKRCLACGEMVDVRYDFCPRCNSSAFDVQPPADSDKFKKKSKNSFIAAIVSFIIAIAMCVVICVQIMGVGFDAMQSELNPYGSHFAYEAEDGSKCFFDMKGLEYSDSDEVLYYDKDDNAYHYDAQRTVFLDDEANEYYSYFCYVDADGYFVYDEDNKIYVEDVDNSYTDDEGNTYFYAPNVSWNDQGKLVDSSSGTVLN